MDSKKYGEQGRPPRLAVGYCRITEEEESLGYPSNEMQRAKIKSFADKHGLTIVSFFMDSPIQMVCGKTQVHKDSYGDVIAMLDYVIESMAIRYVIVSNIDRLKFDILEETEPSTNVEWELERRRKKIFLSGPKAPVFWDDDDVFFERYQEDYLKYSVQQMQKSFTQNHESGRMPNGPVPYGYEKTWHSDGFSIQPSYKESIVIRFIFNRYMEVKSLDKVCMILNENDIKTRRDNNWSRSGILWILKNKIYRNGDIGTEYQGKISISPVIDKKTFDDVQAILSKRSFTEKRRRRRLALLGEDSKPVVYPPGYIDS